MAILFVWSQGSGNLCGTGLIPLWSWHVGRAVLPEGGVNLKTCSPIPHLAIRGAAWVGAHVHPVQLRGARADSWTLIELDNHRYYF